MKFARNLQRHRIPLWANAYLDYDGLKTKIRLLQESATGASQKARVGVVLDDIRHAIHDVEQVYDKIYSNIWDELDRLCMTASLLDQSDWHLTDDHELHFHLGALTQCSATLNQLQEYGAVSSRGFKRLLCKLNRLGLENTSVAHVESELSDAQFSSQLRLIHDIGKVEYAIQQITDVLSCGSFISRRPLILDHFIQHAPIIVKDPIYIYQAIKYDDRLTVLAFIRKAASGSTPRQQHEKDLTMAMIQLAIIYESKECLGSLVRLLQDLEGDSQFATQYLPLVINKVIVKLGHLTRASNGCSAPTTAVYDNSTRSLLVDILDTVQAHVPEAISRPEPSLGRSPLYYIAHYGLVDVCHVLLSQMELSVNHGWSYDVILLEDDMRNSPLRAAVAHGHEEVSELLLRPIRKNGALKTDLWNSVSGPLLADCLHFCPRVFDRLLDTDPDLNGRGPAGQTVLYTAARSGDVGVVKRLLDRGASAAIAEHARGWTPLIVASVEGHIPVVELLLPSDLNPGYQDKLGWTALDHAAFRGHIALSRILRPLVPPSTCPTSFENPAIQSSLSAGIKRISSESVILVNLGSFDSKSSQIPVHIYPSTGENDTIGEPGFGLSIEVSLIGGDGHSYTVDCPIMEDMTNLPWVFHTRHPTHARLLFKILRQNTDLENTQRYDHVGSAAARLSSFRQGLNAGRESLIRDHTIPILSTSGLEDIGMLTFSVLTVTPFEHTEPSVPVKDKLWQSRGRTKIVGHRGLGQNILNPKSLSIGENTALSFSKAMELGADWVELDVQLTKDHVPVVYHDFLVSETGTDAWVHDLSFQQFMHISHSQARRVSNSTKQPASHRPRARSVESGNNCRPAHLAGQMKNTFEFSVKGFKGNTRGDYIHEPFVTLRDVLSQTSDDVSISIELKYPMHFEASHDWRSDTFPIEANLFVDTILATILAHPSCSARSILLSSFNPEICILLALKQDMFPIFFLNDSGNFPTGDVRASSLQEAMRFALRWGLDGIGMSSEPFVFAPRLVSVARARGLVTSSYGALNNEPESAKIQANAGLDIIIVDAVRLISETLRNASTSRSSVEALPSGSQ